ncbi:MAG: alpha/beta fold hydrolase [Campylobacter sp.]|nr:alpha/beta fold hydrolase [Campylobacter sp.]
MASKDIKYGSKTYKISYEILNPKQSESIVFLHGWGANKEIMKKAFGGYFRAFKHIYIDMPGFGESDIFTPLCSNDYAKIVKNFLATFEKEPKIIFGHSFGGKIATLLNPENIVLLSSAGILVKKKFWVRAKIAIFKFLKIFGLGKFYYLFATKDVSGMNRCMYETLKNVVNEDFMTKFANYGGRAFIFWGENDKATPLKSGETIHSLIKNSKFYPLKGDHFFFLLHANFINDTVIKDLGCDFAKEKANEFDEMFGENFGVFVDENLKELHLQDENTKEISQNLDENTQISSQAKDIKQEISKDSKDEVLGENTQNLDENTQNLSDNASDLQADKISDDSSKIPSENSQISQNLQDNDSNLKDSENLNSQNIETSSKKNNDDVFLKQKPKSPEEISKNIDEVFGLKGL